MYPLFLAACEPIKVTSLIADPVTIDRPPGGRSGPKVMPHRTKGLEFEFKELTSPRSAKLATLTSPPEGISTGGHTP
jgi:hypothetical protein